MKVHLANILKPGLDLPLDLDIEMEVDDDIGMLLIRKGLAVENKNE